MIYLEVCDVKGLPFFPRLASRGYLSEASTLGSEYDALERVLLTRSVDGLPAFEGHCSLVVAGTEVGSCSFLRS